MVKLLPVSGSVEHKGILVFLYTIILVGACCAAVVTLVPYIYIFSIGGRFQIFSFVDYFELWRFVSSESLLVGRFFIVNIAAVIFVGIVPCLVFVSSAPKRSLHGDSRFANRQEIKNSGLNAANGIIVGKTKDGYLVQGDGTFVLLAAPTRSDKGVAMAVPNLLNWPHSCICQDIKLENFKITSGYREKKGQDVFLFNPFSSAGKTHRWNVFDNVRRDRLLIVDDILEIAYGIYADTGDMKADFWSGLARNLFLGSCLYLSETNGCTLTLANVYRFGGGSGASQRKQYLKIISQRSSDNSLSEACINALQRFCTSAVSDNTAASIVSTFSEPLLIFASPIVEAATSSSDFSLADVRRKKMTIYLGVTPNRISAAKVLFNLLYTQAVNVNTRCLPAEDASLRYSCMLMMDEATVLGRISAIEKGVSYIAGYNLVLCTIVQSKSQLETTYGKEARNMATNHDTQVIYPPREQQDANEYSEMLGYYTQKSTSKSRNRQQGLIGSGGSTKGESESPQRRALMLPQEIKELPTTQCIVMTRGAKPILCEKPRYYEDPVFMSRLAEVSPTLRRKKKITNVTYEEFKKLAFINEELSSFVPTVQSANGFLTGRINPGNEICTAEKENNVIHGRQNTTGSVDLANDDEIRNLSQHLPEADSQSEPSSESVNAIVDSFFGQLDWRLKDDYVEEDIVVDSASTKKEDSTDHLIDLSVLETE